MIVTIYVTSANYICYESQKSGFFDTKTWVSIFLFYDVKL